MRSADERPLRAAVLGAGFGAQHVAWLSRCPAVSVGYLGYHRDRERAAAVASRYAVPRVLPGEALLDTVVADRAVDLVVIATPVAAHAAATERAAGAGLATVCEKPLAMSAPQARALTELVRARSAPNMVMFQWRFHPAVVAFRELVRQGSLGHLLQLDLRFHHDFLATRESPSGWRHERATAGSGALGDLGVHLVDLLLWITGAGFEVVGSCARAVWSVRTVAGREVRGETDDVATAVLTDPDNGTFATLAVSRVSGHRDLSVEAVGARGRAILQLDPATESADLRSTARRAASWPAGSLPNPYSAFCADMAYPAYPTFDDGLAAQIVLDQIVGRAERVPRPETTRRSSWHSQSGSR